MSTSQSASRGKIKMKNTHPDNNIGSLARLTFSGHETFQCRSLWLKKGYNFLQAGNTFSQPDAVVHLGVGKNMVSSIRFWMNAFGFLSETDELAKYLFGYKGKDKYLERIGSLWLLHFRLVTCGIASTFSLVFNEFRREHPEFTREHLINFLRRKCHEQNESFNELIVDRDIGVFLKTYIRPKSKMQNIEEEFAGIFLELNLIEGLEIIEDSISKRFRIASRKRDEIPPEVILFCILSNTKYGSSISFNELLNGLNSVGTVFALSADGLIKKIDEITQITKGIIYKDDAGIRELQFKTKLDRWEILNGYYAD